MGTEHAINKFLCLLRMVMENIVLYIILVGSCSLFLVNVVATVMVLRTYFIVKKRRYYQIAFIWFVPILGALLVIYLSYEDYFNRKEKKQIGNETNIPDSEAVSYAASSGHYGNR